MSAPGGGSSPLTSLLALNSHYLGRYEAEVLAISKLPESFKRIVLSPSLVDKGARGKARDIQPVSS